MLSGSSQRSLLSLQFWSLRFPPHRQEHNNYITHSSAQAPQLTLSRPQSLSPQSTYFYCPFSSRAILMGQSRGFSVFYTGWFFFIFTWFPEGSLLNVNYILRKIPLCSCYIVENTWLNTYWMASLHLPCSSWNIQYPEIQTKAEIWSFILLSLTRFIKAERRSSRTEKREGRREDFTF